MLKIYNQPILNNFYSNRLNANIKQIAHTALNGALKCDTFTFRGTVMDKKVDKSTNLDEKEKKFSSSLNNYAKAIGDDDENRSNLFISYNQFLQAISKESEDKKDEKLSFVFSSLVEQLDSAPDGEISEVLYMYTFKDFLETYSEEPVIQKAIVDYVNSNSIEKLPLRTALAMRQSRTEQ